MTSCTGRTSSSSTTRSPASAPGLEAPEGAEEIDASDGIVMPGMIDTHRHMWQTALRGYGADWTLAQYFVFFYLEWGKIFRPQDIAAGNLLSAIESLDAGVTTTVDWSHGLQTVDHADAAVDALQSVPGRFVLAYGNIQQGPWEWSASKDFRSFVERRFGTGDDMLGFQMAFDVTGDPEFPEKAAFEVARELGVPVTTHAGVWGATNDDGIKLMHDHGFMAPGHIYVHAATLTEDSYNRIAATGGSVSVSTESEQSAGQGYPPTWQLRKHDIPVSLSMDTSVWWSGDLFCAMRSTLGADRSREHLEAHAKQRRSPTTTCAPSRSSTGRPAAAQGAGQGRQLGAARGGQEGRRRARQERALAGHVPDPAPLRPRRLPGPARRRPHRDRQRPRRQARRPARRHRPGGARARRSTRPSSSPSARSATRLGERHAPRDPRDADPPQPVPVHAMGCRGGAWKRDRRVEAVARRLRHPRGARAATG